MADKELRPPNLTVREVEFRAADESGDGRTLEGYAAVFNESTEIRSWEGMFSETIAPGAFTRSLGERMPVIQFDHGNDVRTGSVPIGAFEDLREDEHGLFVRARLFDNPVVEPIRQAIEGRAITGMSFAFRVTSEEWLDGNGKRIADRDLPGLLFDARDRGPIQRVIRDVDLYEAGPVVFPAYEATSVGVRSQDVPGASGVPAAKDEGIAAVNEQRLTLAECRSRVTEIEAELHQLADEFEGRAMDEGARSNWDKLTVELDTHKAAIRETEERAALLSNLKVGERTALPNGMVAERVAPKGPGVVVNKGVQTVDEIRQASYSRDDYAEKLRDNAFRAVGAARFGAGVKADAAREQVDHLLRNVDGKNGTLAERITATANPVYERAFGRAVMAGTAGVLMGEEARALSTGVDANGGYAVPFALDPTVILANAGSVNPLRQIARVIQITGNTWQGVTSAGVTVSRAAEAAEATDNSPTVAQPEITPTRVHGFVPFSIEVDGDWPQLRSEIAMMLADAKDQEEATSFVTGTGTGTAPQGVVTGVAAVAGSRVDGGATFDASDVYALESALGPRYRSNGRYLANKAIYNLIRQFDTQGGAQLWERIGAGQPSELVGYPAHEASAMDGVINTGTNDILLFGDFSKFAIVDRVGMSVELVPHLFGTTANYPTGQRGLYAIWRNTSKVLVPDAFRLLRVTAA
ncbi:phage major capsid protein [Saccharopolyspora hattusasensis]|uniref:phage major capsid protein n=1 Tax=Saccharopolyspora hattusasensis TaxID=1128679 RepID=UPI003D99B404